MLGKYLEWKGTAFFLQGYVLLPMDLAEQLEYMMGSELPRLYALLKRHRRPAVNTERNAEIVQLHDERKLSFSQIGAIKKMKPAAVRSAYRQGKKPPGAIS